MPSVDAPGATVRLPDEAYVAVLRAFRAWAAFSEDGVTLKARVYDEIQVKRSAPQSSMPLPDQVANFAFAWGKLAPRERAVLWLYYIAEQPGGDQGIAGRYGVRRATVWEWRHTALRVLAVKMGLVEA